MTYWTLNSYTEPRWGYSNMPNVGDKIRYIRDGYTTTVKCVHWNHVCMNDGIRYARHINISGMREWVAKQIVNALVKWRSNVHDRELRNPHRIATPYVEVINV